MITPSPQKPRRRIRLFLLRIWGPGLSLAFHAALIYVLLHAVGMYRVPEYTSIEVAREEITDFTPDTPLPSDDATQAEVGRTDAPGLEGEPEEVTAEDLNVATPMPETAGLDVAASLSPLVIKELGRHQKTLGALQSAYGDRARKNGLLGSYFTSIDFTGSTYMRIDETLNKVWELASPWPGKIQPDCFSVLWTGRLVPQRSGRYTLYLSSDDGARLWINGQLLLDQFNEHERRCDTVEIDLSAGLSYDLKYAFCDAFHHAVSQLEWSCEPAGILRELIPTDRLWADGLSTEQVLQWNEQVPGGAFAHRARMRNPAVVEGKAFSQVVGYPKLDEPALQRIGLSHLVRAYARFAKDGRIPDEYLLPVWAEQPVREVDRDAARDEVSVEIL